MDLFPAGGGSAKPLGYLQITNLAASVGFGTIPDGTAFVVIKPATQAIRFRDDGVAPTASVGYPIAVGQEFVYTGNPAAFRAIEQVASAVLDVLFYGKV